MKKLVVVMSLVSAASVVQAADPLKIGFIGDMSGTYADVDGKGGAIAYQMAIDDFGGSVLGRKVVLITGDHQNKPDIAASKARQWIDEDHVSLIMGGSNSGTALATAKVTDEKKVLYINNGAGTSALTNDQCSPYTVHYTYDTIALSRVAGKAIMDKGYKSWYFLTADYAFGYQLQKDATEVITSNGGKVLGAVKHPLASSDLSSFLLQAQNSGAQVLGLANAGGDTINSVKGATEFGVTKKMKIAGLLIFLTDIHSIGTKNAQGLYVADPWYWNQNDESRKFANRFFKATQRMPTFNQAGDYSSMLTYLNAVKLAGTDEPLKVMEQLQKMKVNDMFTKGGYIRKDGTMVHDFYLYEVKGPEEVKQPWDYYRVLKKVSGEEAFKPLSESTCAFIKK